MLNGVSRRRWRSTSKPREELESTSATAEPAAAGEGEAVDGAQQDEEHAWGSQQAIYRGKWP
jgi:hypothetical protein